MDFFTLDDFTFFSKVVNSNVKPGQREWEEYGSLLKASVFAKTEYWAKLAAGDRFKIEMSWHWQMSGRFREYTWCRIFLEDDEDMGVFFTVGVSSRYHVKGTSIGTLEYKLDCRRAGSSPLSDNQIRQFESLLPEQAKRHVIKADDLNGYDWELLAMETRTFIEKHIDVYKYAITTINAVKKMARICWNENEWRKPSGALGKSISTATTHEKDKGYGYEEWLFDFQQEYGEFCYGFIQAFNKGKHAGKLYDLMLYSIYYDAHTRQSEYYWIGHIKQVYVLDRKEQLYVYEIARLENWIAEMVNDLKAININRLDDEYISLDTMFNVKFRASADNVVLFNPIIRIEDPNKEIGRNKHYVLLDRKENGQLNDRTSGQYLFREGHQEALTGIVDVQVKRSGYSKSLFHKKIQGCIFQQLKAKYEGTGKKVGTEVPTGHGTLIDLVVNCPKEGDTFYEIKTGGSALKCIREGLGQLFEYNFYPGVRNAEKLVIVAPFRADNGIKNYIKHLREKTGIAIYYQAYSRKEEMLVEDLV